MWYEVEIVGGPDIFIHGGSPAQLECRVTDFILPPGDLLWQHNDDTLGSVRNYPPLSLSLSLKKS